MTDIEILESTYFDRCTIQRKVKAKNENTGVTETVEKIIAENVKCALSKFCFFANSYTFLNLSILIIPDGLLSLIIKSCPPR